MAGKPRYASLVEAIDVRAVPEPNSGCWLWSGALGNHGYGVFSFRNQRRLAHRSAYEAHCGPVPEGCSVLHRCDNRCCCNPDHLFLGTHQDNVDDMVSKRRHQHGERHGYAKLTNEQAQQIKDAVGRSQKDLALDYGIDPSTISRIKAGKRWRAACQA